VIGKTATTITTVEGNTNNNGSSEGNGVYIHTRRRTDPYVYGYGRPAYDGVQSADIPITIASVTPIQEDDDMSYVMSQQNPAVPATPTSPAIPAGEGFYLVTPFGKIGLSSMGQVDACLSALGARTTRPWGPTGWEIKHPYPCLQSEADVLDALEQTVRAQAKAV
jgi:hypothetical protein